MAVDVTISSIGSGYNRASINTNFTAIQTALENALSRDGTSPNNMTADLDLDSNDILNLNDLYATRIFIDGDEITTSSLSKGYAGWSPSFAIASDGDRRVLQLTSWIGGEGDVPTAHINEYVGASAFVTLIADGVDIRGPQGATGPGTGDLVAAQNLADVADVATAFGNIKQAASTTSSGVLEIATSAEAIAQTDGERAITPLLMSSFVPIGVVFDYAGASAPTGWLFPYGQAISRTTYSALFAIISTTYGVGDGTTTFNLPDLRGRVVAGQDDMGGTSSNRLTAVTGSVDGDTLGAVGGTETHTLTEAQMPSHYHTSTAAGRPRFGANAGSVGSSFYGSGGDGSTGSTSTMVTDSKGSSSAHNNVQPTIILNKIMFVGV